jgi:Tfp pilus assembly protein PilF
VDHERIRGAMHASVELSKSGKYEEACRVMDDVIAEAIETGDNPWVATLSNHAAILSRWKGDLPLRKHYYELSLIHNPEDPMALYGLADAALEEGQADAAEEYARRCHDAISQSDDELVKRGLLDLVLSRWPDVGK